MKSAETCSCSLCNKFYTYLYRHIFMLDKYIHSSLVWDTEVVRGDEQLLWLRQFKVQLSKMIGRS